MKTVLLVNPKPKSKPKARKKSTKRKIYRGGNISAETRRKAESYRKKGLVKAIQSAHHIEVHKLANDIFKAIKEAGQVNTEIIASGIDKFGRLFN